jgi:hypothetical protein
MKVSKSRRMIVGVRCTLGRVEMLQSKCWSENLKERYRLSVTQIDGRIILKRMLVVIGCENVDWIKMA